MQTEFEAKFLDINVNALRSKLKALGATQKFAERLMKRLNFDYPDNRLEKVGGWIRVRDEGDKVTLSYKQLNHRDIDGTQEVNLVVDNFDAACKFLESIGLKQKSYQETKRESWMLGDVDIEIDTWPWIPPFVELEGTSEQAIKDLAANLGLDWSKALHGSVETAYQSYYDFTEEEIDNWPKITFGPTPSWLEQKRVRTASEN